MSSIYEDLTYERTRGPDADAPDARAWIPTRSWTGWRGSWSSRCENADELLAEANAEAEQIKARARAQGDQLLASRSRATGCWRRP